MTATGGFDAWNVDWMKAQQQYWDAWRALAAKAPGATPDFLGRPSPWSWSNGIDQWWQATGAAMPAGDMRDYWERTVTQGKSFCQFSEVMMQVTRSITEAAKAGEDWRKRLQEQFDGLKRVFTESGADAAHKWRGFMAFSELPLDTWGRVASMFSMAPGDALKNLRGAVFEHLDQKFHAEVDRFLSVPGVGYTREAQQEAQTATKLLLDYQRVHQEYCAAHAQLISAALDRMLQRIQSLADRGETITSLRQLYDLWVDVGEEVYAEFVMQPEFSSLYGRMVNALMAVKRQGREVLDEVLGALNMPTREEIDTVLERQQALRRQVRALEEAGPVAAVDGAALVDALRSEISALRDDLARAKESQTPAAAEMPSRRTVPQQGRRRSTRAVAAPAPASAWDLSGLVAIGAPEPAADKRPGRRRAAAGRK